MRICYLFLLLIFTACSSDSNKRLDNIEEIKKDFIATILTESVLDEGPFQMNYHLRAILFSDNVVSLMGELFVFDHLPHGWTQYEGKTYVKINSSLNGKQAIPWKSSCPLLIIFFLLGIGTTGSVMSKKIIQLPFKRINYEIMDRKEINCTLIEEKNDPDRNNFVDCL